MRRDVQWRRHPRIKRLGWFGATVLEQLWCIAKILGRAGFIPAIYLDESHVAGEMFLDDPLRIAEIPAIIELAIGAGLLQRVEGGVQVHDWEQYQADPTSAQRVRRFRGSVTDHTVTPVAVPSRPVPSRPVTRSTSEVDSRRKSNGHADVDRVLAAFRETGTRLGLKMKNGLMPQALELHAVEQALQSYSADQIIASFEQRALLTQRNVETWRREDFRLEVAVRLAPVDNIARALNANVPADDTPAYHKRKL